MYVMCKVHFFLLKNALWNMCLNEWLNQCLMMGYDLIWENFENKLISITY